MHLSSYISSDCSRDMCAAASTTCSLTTPASLRSLSSVSCASAAACKLLFQIFWTVGGEPIFVAHVYIMDVCRLYQRAHHAYVHTRPFILDVIVTAVVAAIFPVRRGITTRVRARSPLERPSRRRPSALISGLGFNVLPPSRARALAPPLGRVKPPVGALSLALRARVGMALARARAPRSRCIHGLVPAPRFALARCTGAVRLFVPCLNIGLVVVVTVHGATA